MTALKLNRFGVYALITAAATGAALLAVRARAAGIPDAAALTYTGYLENPDGTPVTGKKSIGLSVYDAEAKGKEVCRLDPADVEPLSGRFQLVLPDNCTDAVKANPDLWVEVMVEGTLLGRTKLGAVPYAVEAGRASDSSGLLEKRLAAIEARLGPRSAARAYMKDNQSIPDNADTVVKFNGEDWDDGKEYDPATATFTANEGGLYAATCSVRFETAGPGTSGWWSAAIEVNGERVAQDGTYGDGWTAFRNPVCAVKLKTGDQVTCIANHQASGAARPVAASGAHFEIVRLDQAD